MKKLIITATLLLTIGSANSFFKSDIEFPLADNNQYNKGMFAYNKYDVLDPKWFTTEFGNFIDAFDSTNTDKSFYTEGYEFPAGK
ncbi:MAG: hypothetical protein HOC17_05070 [Candidatus Ruthia sp.]|jgi:hypothetical protein|nr:hypothetical protein [Candidatus Ruthturnera sp.]